MKFEDSPEQTGVMVEAADGRVFFLPSDKADAFLVSTDESNIHRALMHAGRSPLGPIGSEVVSNKSDPVAHPLASCRYMLHWLLTHNPDSMVWRQNSVMWMNRC